MPINFAFPLQDDKVKNFLFKSTLTTKEALKSNLLLLLNTNKGERYYLPDYGTDLNKYIFEGREQNSFSNIEEDIKKTVKKYIPQLTITEVVFYELQNSDKQEISENEIEIHIKFIYNDNVFGKEDQVVIVI